MQDGALARPAFKSHVLSLWVAATYKSRLVLYISKDAVGPVSWATCVCPVHGAGGHSLDGLTYTLSTENNRLLLWEPQDLKYVLSYQFYFLKCLTSQKI